MGKIANNGYINDLLQYGGVLDRTQCYSRQLIEEDFSGDYPGGSLQLAPLEKYAMNQLVQEVDILVSSVPSVTYFLSFNSSTSLATKTINLSPDAQSIGSAAGAFYSSITTGTGSPTRLTATAASNVNWITGVSVQTYGSGVGYSVTGQVQSNSSGAARTGRITITQQGSGATIIITITQRNGVPVNITYTGADEFSSHLDLNYGTGKTILLNKSQPATIYLELDDINWYLTTDYNSNTDRIEGHITFSGLRFDTPVNQLGDNSRFYVNGNDLLFTVENTLLGLASARMTAAANVTGFALLIRITMDYQAFHY